MVRKRKTVDAAAERRPRAARPARPAEQAKQALDGGALLIDIRSDGQRARDGLMPGAKVVPRNELEWRLDPDCDYRDPELARPGRAGRGRLQRGLPVEPRRRERCRTWASSGPPTSTAAFRPGGTPAAGRGRRVARRLSDRAPLRRPREPAGARGRARPTPARPGWTASCWAATTRRSAPGRARCVERCGSSTRPGSGATWTAGASTAATLPPAHARLLDRCRELLGEELTAELAALPGAGGARRRALLPRLAGLGPDQLLPGARARTRRSCSRASRSRGSCSATPTSSSAGASASGVELVNPGSVGLPWDGDRRAAWALCGRRRRAAPRRVRLAGERRRDPGAARRGRRDSGQAPRAGALRRRMSGRRRFASLPPMRLLAGHRTPRPRVLRPLRGGRRQHPPGCRRCSTRCCATSRSSGDARSRHPDLRAGG